jgi:hypothetical protein
MLNADFAAYTAENVPGALIEPESLIPPLDDHEGDAPDA